MPLASRGGPSPGRDQVSFTPPGLFGPGRQEDLTGAGLRQGEKKARAAAANQQQARAARARAPPSRPAYVRRPAPPLGGAWESRGQPAAAGSCWCWCCGGCTSGAEAEAEAGGARLAGSAQSARLSCTGPCGRLSVSARSLRCQGEDAAVRLLLKQPVPKQVSATRASSPSPLSISSSWTSVSAGPRFHGPSAEALPSGPTAAGLRGLEQSPWEPQAGLRASPSSDLRHGG